MSQTEVDSAIEDSMPPTAKRAKLNRISNKKSRIAPSIPRPIGTGISQTYRTKLRYAYHAVFQCSTVTNLVFRAGSLFDPEYAVGGHQPYYYDQLSALYQHYIVHKSKINVTATGYGILAAPTASTSTLVLRGDDTATGLTTTKTTLMELPGSKFVKFPAWNTGNSVTRQLTMSYDKNKIFKNFKNSDLQAQVGTNPAEDWYFIVSGWTDSGPTAQNIWLDVIIDYDVEFFEAKDPPGS